MSKFFISIILTLCWLLMSITNVLALNLTDAVVRLERIKTGENPVPVLVMFKSVSVTTEDGIRLRVDNEWEVDLNSTDITVSTTSLPAGVVAVPGINSANDVAGRLISFPCDDLTTGVNYGFYITGGIGVNPVAGDQYKWLLETMSLGGVVDQAEVKISVTNDDQIVVTGRVGAKITDFQLNLTKDRTGDLRVGDEIDYQINYGSYLQNTVKPLIITAEWSRGTVEGSPTPSVDIVDYVIGSGSTAMGGVEPVVDLINRRIKWTISSFPANTINQSVGFKLKVNDSYTGLSSINFDVSGLLNGANVITVNETLNNTIKPTLIFTPTPTLTPTVGPTASQSVGATTSIPTPTPTLIPALKINKIDLKSISESTAGIAVLTNLPLTSIKIRYGKTIMGMNNSVISVNGLASDVLNIDGLVKDTDYYFRVEVTDLNGRVVRSDIYTFRTALSSDKAQVVKESLLVSIGNNVLLDAKAENETTNFIIITPNQKYAFRLNLTRPEIIKNIKISILNQRTLGINTIYGAESNSVVVDLAEIVDGGFVGHLVSPSQTGFYDILVRIEDTNGNISQQKIGDLRVVGEFMVSDQSDKSVENAKVILYRYNVRKKIYELIAPDFLGIKNPMFTEPNGKLYLVLPRGKYRAEIEAIGYENKEVEFSLGFGDKEIMPQVKLSKTKISVADWFKYYSGTVDDASGISKKFFANLTTSIRFFKLISWTVMFAGLGVLWLYLSYLYKVNWWLLPRKLIYEFLQGRFYNNKRKIWGRVTDDNNDKPVVGAMVFLLDDKFNIVLSKAKTDKLGNFVIDMKKAGGYRLTVVRDGYEPTPMREYTKEGLLAGEIEIKMENVLSFGEKIGSEVENISVGIRNILVSTGLVILLIMELMFWRTFGLNTVWPWVVISWFSVGLWLTMVLNK